MPLEMSRPWSGEEESRLLEMTRAGGKGKTIADALGRSPAACYARRAKLGVRVRRDWTALDVKRLVAWRAEGVSLKECARRLGRNWKACCFAYRKHGPPLRGFTRAADHDFRIKRLHALGYCTLEIARRIGCHYATVRKHLRSLGLSANGNASKVERERAATRARGRRKRGAPSWGDYTKAKRRREAEAAGWPEADTRRAAALFELLFQRGPMTRGEITPALGYSGRGKKNDGVRRLMQRPLLNGLLVVAGRKFVGRSSPKPTFDLAPHLRHRREERS